MELEPENERIAQLSVMMSKKLAKVCAQFADRIPADYIALNLVYGAVVLFAAIGYEPGDISKRIKECMLIALEEEMKHSKEEQKPAVH